MIDQKLHSSYCVHILLTYGWQRQWGSRTNIAQNSGHSYLPFIRQKSQTRNPNMNNNTCKFFICGLNEVYKVKLTDQGREGKL